MKYSETILYIVIFAVIYNLIGLLSLRAKVGTEKKLPDIVTRLFTPVIVALTISFVTYSCYIAYQGFADIYSKSMALLATSFFGITGAILIRKLVLTLAIIFGRSRLKK